MMEQYIKDGFALVIFPEGRRSLKAQIITWPQRSDAYRPAYRALILPVGIPVQKKMRGFWYFLRPQITVNFGKHFQLPGK